MKPQKLTEQQQMDACINLGLLKEAVQELTEPWREAELGWELALEQHLEVPAYIRANNPRKRDYMLRARDRAAAQYEKMHREWMLSAPVCCYLVEGEPRIGLELVEA